MDSVLAGGWHFWPWRMPSNVTMTTGGCGKTAWWWVVIQNITAIFTSVSLFSSLCCCRPHILSSIATHSQNICDALLQSLCLVISLTSAYPGWQVCRSLCRWRSNISRPCPFCLFCSLVSVLRVLFAAELCWFWDKRDSLQHTLFSLVFVFSVLFTAELCWFGDKHDSLQHTLNFSK